MIPEDKYRNMIFSGLEKEVTLDEPVKKKVILKHKVGCQVGVKRKIKVSKTPVFE